MYPRREIPVISLAPPLTFHRRRRHHHSNSGHKFTTADYTTGYTTTAAVAILYETTGDDQDNNNSVVQTRYNRRAPPPPSSSSHSAVREIITYPYLSPPFPTPFDHQRTAVGQAYRQNHFFYFPYVPTQYFIYYNPHTFYIIFKHTTHTHTSDIILV